MMRIELRGVKMKKTGIQYLLTVLTQRRNKSRDPIKRSNSRPAEAATAVIVI